MNLSILSIRRPVLAIVLSILIVLIGAVGYSFLGVRQFPDVDPPNITVTTTYTGANADVIESQITEPLEESINGIAGIKSITSASSDGRSNITVEFELGEDLEASANDVRDRVSRAQRNLPPDADPPIVAKADANSNAILVMTVQSTARSLTELTDIGTNLFKERLQTIPGVGNITIWGERRYAMRLIMDPDRLGSYGLTPADVRDALQRENVELPAGRLEGKNTELSLRAVGRLSKPEEFEDLILRAQPGATVRLRDVARVYLGAENERTILKRDGSPMIGLAIAPLPGANQVEIADEFYRRLDVLVKSAPKDIVLDVAFDNTKFIRKAVFEVQETLLIAFGLVVLIIFIFLRSWRATIIPVVAIPVSLISGFFFLWLAGFSINVLTLLGIVLATGLVVDDAIVVMENIFVHIEEGLHPREAGEKGATEIYFAIISTTITLVVVFIPVIFLQGLTGRLFREFGLVVAMSIAVSAFVSLTLTPMMSTRMLRHEEKQSWLTRVTEPFFIGMNRFYERTLHSVIKRPWLAAVVMLACVGTIYMVGRVLKSGLPPLEDRSALSLSITAPEGYTFDRMDSFMDTLTSVVDRTIPEKKLLITVTSPSFAGGGSNSGFARLILKDPEERPRSQMQIANELTATMRGISEARTIVAQEQTIATGGGRPGLSVQYVLQASELSDLRRVLPKFIDLAQKDPTFAIVDVNLKFNKPEVAIEIDRARARELGLSVLSIADVLQAGFSGQRFGYFIMGGKQYQVIGEYERSGRSTPDNIPALSIRTPEGLVVPLADLVKMTEQSSPPQLYRYNRYVSATVSAEPVPGKTIADGIAAMDNIARNTLDESFTTSLSGPSRDFAESSSSLVFAFMLALALVYLILAAQFESFVDPLTIMLTVPLALAGAVLSLWLTGESLNIFSQIGCIVLIGLVTKNGILIVEFANQRREAGLDWKDAVQEAAASRFRPILMTSLATILGALPIALSLGAASGSRVGMGVVIVGGMIFATFLTLYIIPSLYVILSRIKRHKGTHVPAKAAAVVGMLLLAVVPMRSQGVTTLDEAIGNAMKSNYNVQVARQDSVLATATGKGSVTPFMPTVNVTGSYVRGSNDVSQILASGQVIERNGAGYTNMGAAAGLTWTLFDGLKMFATSDRATVLEQGGVLQARSRMAMTVADVVTAYSSVIANQRVLNTTKDAFQLADQRYVIETNRFKVGSNSGVEMSQAEVDRNTVKGMVLRGETDLFTAKTTLNRLMARKPMDPLDVDTTLDVPTLPSLDSLQTELERQNYDVLAAERQLEAASLHVREVDSRFFPQVAANLGYSYTNNKSDAGFLIENRQLGWNVGVNFSYNLFNGFTDKLDAEKARVDAERQRLMVQDIRADQLNRLAQTYRRYEQGKALMDVEQASLTAAQRNAGIAVDKLRLGLITSIEARQTLQTLLEIGARLAQVEFETRVAGIEALRLAGRLLR